MATRGGRGGSQRPDAAKAYERNRDWLSHNGSSVEGVRDWDIRDGVFVAAVLGLLAEGCAVMFGTGAEGRAVSITVWDGDNKQRKWVSDAVELDLLLESVVSRLRKEGPAS